MTPRTRPWAGWSLVAIGVVHDGVGLVAGWAPLVDGVAAGAVGVWDEPPARGFVYWFLAFGVMCLVAGAAVAQVERSHQVPSWPLVTLTVLLTVAGVVTSPASGFWLALVPSAVLVVRRVRGSRRTEETT